MTKGACPNCGSQMKKGKFYDEGKPRPTPKNYKPHGTINWVCEKCDLRWLSEIASICERRPW